MRIEKNSVIFDAINLLPEIEITVRKDTYETAYDKLKDRLIKFEAPRNGVFSKRAGILTVTDNFYGIDYADISLYFTPEEYLLQSVVVQPNWHALKEINIDDDIVKLIRDACEYELNNLFERESNIYTYTNREYKSNDLIISTILSFDPIKDANYRNYRTIVDSNYHIVITKELERF